MAIIGNILYFQTNPYVSRWIWQKIKIRCLSKITMSRKPGSSTRSFLAWKRASDVFFSLKFKRSIRVSTWQKGCVVSLWLGTLGGLLPRTLSYLAVKSAVAVMSLIIVEEKNVRNHHDYQNFCNCHSNSGRWWKNAINMARFNLQKK